MRLLRGVGKVARGFALAAAASAVLFALALYDEGSWVLLAAVAAVPAVILFVFSLAVLEAAELPGRLRNAPAQVGELAAAAEELRRARGRRVAGALWRTGRHAASARELATPWAPLLPLFSLPFLAATAVSAMATPLLVVASLVALTV